MAVHLNVLAFLDHLVEFFSSNADQRFFHTFSAAVAVELCGQCIIDLDIKTFQYFLKKAFRCMALLQKAGNRIDL